MTSCLNIRVRQCAALASWALKARLCADRVRALRCKPGVAATALSPESMLFPWRVGATTCVALLGRPSRRGREHGETNRSAIEPTLLAAFTAASKAKPIAASTSGKHPTSPGGDEHAATNRLPVARRHHDGEANRRCNESGRRLPPCNQSPPF